MYPRYFKCPVCKERTIPFRDKRKIKSKRPARCSACGSELQVNGWFIFLFVFIVQLPMCIVIFFAIFFFPIALDLHWVSGLLIMIIGLIFTGYLFTLVIPLKQVEPRNDKNSDDFSVGSGF